MKTLNEISIKGHFLNTIKAIYEKPTTNNIINGKTNGSFSLRSSTKPLSFNIVLTVLAKAIMQEKELTGIQIRKEDIKFHL